MSSDLLIQAILDQSKLSISQAISLIENQSETGSKLLSNIFQYTGHAYRIGITGPPGAGKSSLTDNLISAFRKADKTVAVIAVDPTSPAEPPYSSRSLFLPENQNPWLRQSSEERGPDPR